MSLTITVQDPSTAASVTFYEDPAHPFINFAEAQTLSANNTQRSTERDIVTRCMKAIRNSAINGLEF
jgi:hypothetical protein